MGVNSNANGYASLGVLIENQSKLSFSYSNRAFVIGNGNAMQHLLFKLTNTPQNMKR